jgi:hypothetical protein
MNSTSEYIACLLNTACYCQYSKVICKGKCLSRAGKECKYSKGEYDQPSIPCHVGKYM